MGGDLEKNALSGGNLGLTEGALDLENLGLIRFECKDRR